MLLSQDFNIDISTMLPVLGLHEQHLQRETDAIARSEQDVRDVDAELATMQRQMDHLELPTPLARQDGMGGDVATPRRAVSPISVCPDDVLRAIFIQRAQDLDAKWPEIGRGIFNKSRASAPFIAAAVCQAWRCIALSTPRMWDYAGVQPLSPGTGEARLALERIRTVVERSGAAPIDVLFHQISGKILTQYTEILDVLYPHLARWRLFEVYCTEKFPGLINYLRGPAPCLVELCLIDDGVPSTRQTASTHLQEACKLRTLYLSGSALPIATQEFPALENLFLRAPVEMPISRLWSMFSSATHLKSLSLDLKLPEIGVVGKNMPSRLHLSALTRLRLAGDAITLTICHPKLLPLDRISSLELFSIRIGQDTIDRAIDSLPKIFDKLETLTLFNTTVGHANASSIFGLGKLATLTMNWCCIQSGVWPQLVNTPQSFQKIVLGKGTLFLNRLAVEEFANALKSRARDAEVPSIAVDVSGASDLTARESEELCFSQFNSLLQLSDGHTDLAVEHHENAPNLQML